MLVTNLVATIHLIQFAQSNLHSLEGDQDDRYSSMGALKKSVEIAFCASPREPLTSFVVCLMVFGECARWARELKKSSLLALTHCICNKKSLGSR